MKREILWEPTKQYLESSAMSGFLNHVASKYFLDGNDYDRIYRWSIDNPALFWDEVVRFCGVRFSTPPQYVLNDVSRMPGAHWFEGAKLNYAEHLLATRDNTPALIFYGEEKVRKTLTYAELYEQVRRAANALRAAGIKKGDRVAAFMPNMPETVIAMLATTALGATWSSTSPDFGIKGVTDRFAQIEPKIVFAADGYFYKGKPFNTLDKLEAVTAALPSAEQIVITGYTGHMPTEMPEKWLSWEQFLQKGEDKPLEFEQVPFSHPLFIMFSSGTTGLPKAIIHSAGGTLVQHLKELILHSNIQKGQTVFYYTTCGWMMWNWFVSALATGATLVLYDGNPFYPSPDALIRMADELNLTFFGTSAKYLAALEAEGVVPKEISSFPHLKVIASTGSPLTAASFRYVYNQWKKDVQLSSIAGGTDIISCFMLGNPVLPVRLEEIQCRGLGMAVECFDDNGNPLREQQGELVCTKPFPSMPVGFLNDPGDKRFRDTYFSKYPDVWWHGDNIVITENGGVVMYGRSDATLNPQGVRIGTAEIYGALEDVAEVDDSVVVGKKVEGDEQVVLFVVLKPGATLTPELEKKIRDTIRQKCSPRHVPAVIREVPEIPYTINGKKVEIAVKKIINGEKVVHREALANPESLEFYYDILNNN